jgi:hypothetical protein
MMLKICWLELLALLTVDYNNLTGIIKVNILIKSSNIASITYDGSFSFKSPNVDLKISASL